jgi:hypothetical protein
LKFKSVYHRFQLQIKQSKASEMDIFMWRNGSIHVTRKVIAIFLSLTVLLFVCVSLIL